MKLTLVNLPTLVSNPKRLPLVQEPPLGLAYVAAALAERGHDVRAVDGLGEGIGRLSPFRDGFHLHGLPIAEIVERIEPDSDAIGIGVMFSGTWPLARALIDAIRARFPRTAIICGGEHVTALTRFVMTDAPIDYAVVGEGEETVAELAAHLAGEPGALPLEGIEGLAYRTADGAIATTPRRRRRRALDEIAWPAWGLFPLQRYMDTPLFFATSLQAHQRPMVILATRGCPYTCKFCSNEQMWGINYFMRDPVDVVDEMEHYVRRYGATDFHFNDLTPIINARWARQLCEVLIARDLGVTWKTASGTRSEALDLDLLQKMHASGCDEIVLAPESGSPEILAINRKRVKLDKLLTVARLVRDHHIGMRVTALMIVGFPEETLRDVLRSYRLLARMARGGFSTVYVSRFMAYPGCEYHAIAAGDGRITHGDEFFFNLQRNLTLMNVRNSGTSWHPRWSGRVIWVLAMLGYAVFFGTYYASKPLEVARGVRGVLRNQPRSRFEHFLANLLWRPPAREPALRPPPS
ncbi:MAG: B12-binding domain-containing radical SAM protein [Candidatus Binatia bacterium]